MSNQPEELPASQTSIPMSREIPTRISLHQLPFACPPPDSAVWDLHPRVYLSFERIGEELPCPYCGARYLLVADAHDVGGLGA